MTVEFDKDRGRWRYDFWLHKIRHRGYCANEDGTAARNRTEARAAQDIVRGTMLRRPVGTPARSSHTWAQALAAYAEIAKHHRNWESIKDYLIELKDWFGPASRLDTIEPRVPDYIRFSRRQKIYVWRGGPRNQRSADLRRIGGDDLWRDTGRRRSDSTTNRYLTTLRTILNLAHATKDPATGNRLLAETPGFANLREPEIAPRPLGDATLRRILATAPQHQADTIILCIDGGLRLNEALALQNDQLDVENRGLWLSHTNTKGRRDEFVPLSDHAFRLAVQRVRESRQAGRSHIILYRGSHGTEPPRPIRSISRSWATTLKKLGLKGRFRFHNTRADYVSFLGNRQVPPAALKDLARHRDFKTTLRYLKVSDETKRAAVALLDGRGATAGLKVVPVKHKAGTKRAPGPPQKSPTPIRAAGGTRRKAAI